MTEVSSNFGNVISKKGARFPTWFLSNRLRFQLNWGCHFLCALESLSNEGSFSRSSDIPVTETQGPQEFHIILEVPLRFLLTINPIVSLIKGSVPLYSIHYGPHS